MELNSTQASETTDLDISTSEHLDGSRINRDGVVWIVQIGVLIVFIIILFFCFCKYYESFVANWAEARSSGNLSDLEYMASVLDRRRVEEELKLDSPEVRRSKLIANFKKNKVIMVVEEHNLIGRENASSTEGYDQNIIDDLEMEESGILSIPLSDGTPRYFPNCCAVCLCTYEVGENVVLSANSQCHHVFHYECILQWLVKIRKGSPCPCCRQEFTDLSS